MLTPNRPLLLRIAACSYMTFFNIIAAIVRTTQNTMPLFVNISFKVSLSTSSFLLSITILLRSLISNVNPITPNRTIHAAYTPKSSIEIPRNA